MKRSKEYEQEMMAIIRSMLVRNPNLTGTQIKNLLANNPKRPIPLDKDYVYKLLKKIRTARAYRINQMAMTDYLSKFSDEAEELKQRLWSIILNDKAKDKDVVSAVKELRNTSKELFDKMFESGIFERQLGKMEIKHTLSEEDKAIVANALENAFGKRTTEHGN